MTEGVLLTVGFLLVAGVIGGSLAKWFNLPKLTGYLAAGIVVGHQGFDLLPHEQVDALSMPVNELAMALVLFVLGGQFRFASIREHFKPLMSMSLLESGITFGLVPALTYPVLGSLGGSILLGVMAIAVAPATTVEVLREYRADGPVSDGLRLLCALSNVWAILFFEIALLVLFALSGFEATPWDAAWDVLGAMLYGLVAGHALILMQERIGRGNYSVALLTTLLLTIGVCQATGVPHMLAMLVTGAVVVNRSRFFDPVVDSMEHFAQPAYVAFFVLSGMHLDFQLGGRQPLRAGARDWQSGRRSHFTARHAEPHPGSGGQRRTADRTGPAVPGGRRDRIGDPGRRVRRGPRQAAALDRAGRGGGL